MSPYLQALAHCCAILAMVLFAGWIVALLVTDPTTYRGRASVACRCGNTGEASHDWKQIDNQWECPACTGIKRAVWQPGDEDEAA